MSVLRRTRTTAPAVPAPDTDLNIEGSAVDELLKPITKQTGNPVSRGLRRLVRRPKA